jgi:hypothetical protein
VVLCGSEPFLYGRAVRRLAVLSALLLVSLSAVALASPDESVTTNEPQPGGTIKADSQPIGSAGKVIVGVAGRLGKTTVGVEGGVKINKETGDAVAACWLAGPGAIPVTNKRIKDILNNDPDIRDAFEAADAKEAVVFCMLLVKTVAENLVNGSRSAVGAQSAASGCSVKPLNLRFTRRNGKKVVTLTKTRPTTRYSCAKAKGGISLTARAPKGRKLSRELGSKLGVGLYKSTDGLPSSGKLTLRYRLR